MGQGKEETKDEKKSRIFMEIINLLKDLDPEQRENVLRASAIFYGIKIEYLRN